jgi:pimeloyl-ACP methyl ester carboxylesterase
MKLRGWLMMLVLPLLQSSAGNPTTAEVVFKSHDGHDMSGRLTLPAATSRQTGTHAVIVYVQTAEGMTIDMKRLLGGGRTFNYFDLYRRKLPEMNVGFFSYEGRGVSMGDEPPRFETIDREVYNSSTLENKVRDVLSAVEAVRAQPGVDPERVFLMGASEGTLLAAEAASRAPDRIAGLILYAVMADNMRETFRYIVTDGGFFAYRGFFDTDADGRISEAEFVADPRQYRARVFQNAEFRHFDSDADGYFTVDDMRVLVRPYLEAIANEDFAVLNAWARTAAGVSTPDNWFRDHFRHEPIWTFLSRLTMPVGLFHGTDDTSTSVQGVRRLEAQAAELGRTNLSFHYFDKQDHSLGVIAYFVDGTLPEGHQAIFRYIAERVAVDSR